jgi:hypothetical protein
MEQLLRREDLVLPSDLVRDQTHPLPRGGTDVMKQAPPTVSARLTASRS